LAEEFSNFFMEKISKIRSDIDNNPARVPPAPDKIADIPPLLEYRNVTEDEVHKLITQSKNKQCDLDPLPTSLLKECLEDSLPLITKIINTSLSLGDVPPEMKKAIVKPLLKKKGLELIYKNYRPVSNLSFISKLIEKIVANQFNEHLDRYNLQNPFQSAYRKYHSTETALLKVQNDILQEIDEGKAVLLVLLDLSAAIDHNILLSRLSNSFGIKGTALKWFRSYLLDRTQVANINGKESEPQYLKFGVPQGSVLGPLLFTAYMAPLKDL
jgi:hypothetical protein